MPPEGGPLQLTLMAWPCRIGRLPVARPWRIRLRAGAHRVGRGRERRRGVRAGADAGASRRCSARAVAPTSRVELLEADLDDACLRDNGPIFVTDRAGRVALVQFRYNAWGEKYLPYANDARVPELIARDLGVRRYVAPILGDERRDRRRRSKVTLR